MAWGWGGGGVGWGKAGPACWRGGGGAGNLPSLLQIWTIWTIPILCPHACYLPPGSGAWAKERVWESLVDRDGTQSPRKRAETTLPPATCPCLAELRNPSYRKSSKKLIRKKIDLPIEKQRI